MTDVKKCENLVSKGWLVVINKYKACGLSDCACINLNKNGFLSGGEYPMNWKWDLNHIILSKSAMH